MTNDEITNEQIIANYLAENDYASVEEWAQDSGYRWDKNYLLWRDEFDDEVDIESCLYYAIEAMWLAAHED